MATNKYIEVVISAQDKFSAAFKDLEKAAEGTTSKIKGVATAFVPTVHLLSFF